MALPIRFPGDVAVIIEEVTRFRKLTPSEQIQQLDEMFRLYHKLRIQSGYPDVIDRLADEKEQQARTAIFDFVKRHEKK